MASLHSEILASADALVAGVPRITGRPLSSAHDAFNQLTWIRKTFKNSMSSVYAAHKEYLLLQPVTIFFLPRHQIEKKRSHIAPRL
jgi:hypothetical protein